MYPSHEDPKTRSGRGEASGAWMQGRSTVEYMVANSRLELIAAEGADSAVERVLGRAGRRLVTAEAGFSGGDVEGAFVAVYDAYRMAAESLLALQGLRAAGEGSHVTVENAVSNQFAGEISAFAKPTFERFRRMRHSAQYFDPDAPEITAEDAVWAMEAVRSALQGTRRIIGSGRLSRFDPSSG